jgi:multidrug efflux pump
MPLAFASGAGAEMRQAMGVAVMYGMLGVTVFGLIFTPLFYALLSRKKSKKHSIPLSTQEYVHA